MSVYDKQGNELEAIYDKSGESLEQAYDKLGNPLFSGGRTTKRLKIMEYNVGHWYIGTADPVPAEKEDAYYALQNGMISSNDPDILFICEYSDKLSNNISAYSMLTQHFPYIVRKTTSEVGYFFGRAICSKYPLTNYAVNNYAGNANRYYDTVTVTVDGVEITLCITHLNTDNNQRPLEFTELRTFINGLDTFIMAGDLNTLDCKSVSGTDYTNMIWPLIHDGFNLANCADFGFIETYQDGGWTGCLDNIVTSSDISVVSARRDDTKLTDGISDKIDHMPLISVIEIDTTQEEEEDNE